MEARKEVALESPLDVRGRRLTPVTVTVTWVHSSGDTTGLVVVVHESIGIIVQDDLGVRALMLDGRELTLDELAAEYPGLDFDAAGFR